MAVSVDTFRSEVAARAIERFGPLIINDISAGELDPAMPAVAAKYGVPYIAMHMKGDPKTMQSLTDYKRDITAEVVAYFEARVAALLAAGIAREHLVLDPGFGFAKTTEQNYELLAGLHRLCALGYPVLAGLSRKSMIYRVLGVTPAQSLAGTVALGCRKTGRKNLPGVVTDDGEGRRADSKTDRSRAHSGTSSMIARRTSRRPKRKAGRAGSPRCGSVRAASTAAQGNPRPGADDPVNAKTSARQTAVAGITAAPGVPVRRTGRRSGSPLSTGHGATMRCSYRWSLSVSSLRSPVPA